MKVLHLIPSLSPKRGGPTTAVLGMVRSLRATGIDATIATTNDDGAGTIPWSEGELTEVQGVPARIFGRWSPSVRPVREYQYSGGLRRWLNQNMGDYDLVHTHVVFSFAPTYGMWLARQLGIPYLNRPAGLLCDWSMAQQQWKKKTYWSLSEKSNLAGVAAMHYTSEKERIESQRWVGERPCFVLPLGSDLTSSPDGAKERVQAKFGLKPSDKILIFLGRIHPKKGLDVLIELLADCPAEPWHLLIAGEGEESYLATIRALVVAKGLTARVTWTGFADENAKADYLAAADLFFLFSHSENFGVSVVEALRAGCPVCLSTEVPLAEEVRKEGWGEVIDLKGSARKNFMAGVLQAVPWTEERRQEIMEKASRTFDWSALGQRLARHYEDLLAVAK